MQPEDFPGLALLEMVGVLHGRGLEGLRATPAMAASGVHWRLTLGTLDPGVASARYSTGSGVEYFGWPSTTGLSPEGLADRFAVAFSELALAAVGPDPAYVAWFRRLLEVARQGWIPYFYADWPTDGFRGVPLLGPEEGRPVLEEPPGGLALRGTP